MKKIIFHITFWFIILFWRANADLCCCIPLYKFMLYHSVSLPVVIISTYFTLYYLLPKYLIEKINYLKFALLFFISFFIANTVYSQLIHSELMYQILQLSSNAENKVFGIKHPYRSAFMVFSILGLSLLFRMFEIFLEQEQAKHRLQEEYTNTQLAFLKSQVNPHFLFNALNNIYSLAVRKNEPEIAKSLENLSGIMRYLSYDSSEKFVPLSKEIQLLENYIDIQQMRISETDDISISFVINGDIQDVEIAPVIFLPLVENAFKHGLKAEFSSIISISIVINQEEIALNIRNTFFEKTNNQLDDKAIGLKNVIKRLELIYPKRYTFTTEQKDAFFLTNLKIKT